ncbi:MULTISPECIES: polyprenyl synthetase family protein [unclassified Helicobacter]|uniref:polyprenyl synthetase family protein n=1 Tax=unclassified Helicobacter TaxID=2593540 RepID=UPI001F223257|nr:MULTISPECIES: polyprenyl synthetase family protein [unclassified Helicobacter]
MLLKIQEKIKDFIDEVDSEVVNIFFKKMQMGKMLRSKLMLAICPKHQDIITLCAIIEMIQIASLLHDDVIDESKMRRGKPSINTLFGDKNAIMLGDVFYSKAFYELTNFDKKISQSIANCVVRLSRGEISDVSMGEKFQEDKHQYFAMIEDKTASLIASSAQSAAILMGLDAKRYYDYGLNLGIAFQIIDDLLDVFGKDEVLGKPAMSDYVEGKTTLPYLFLYENLKIEDKKQLVEYFKISTPEAKEWILLKMEEFDIFKKTQECARDYAYKALESIQGEENIKLEQIVKDMIYREF